MRYVVKLGIFVILVVFISSCCAKKEEGQKIVIVLNKDKKKSGPRRLKKLSRKVKKILVGDVSSRRAHIRWAQVEGVSGYELQYSWMEDFRENFSFDLLKDENRFLIGEFNPLTPETVYFVRIRPVFQKRKGKWSKVVTFKTEPEPEPRLQLLPREMVEDTTTDKTREQFEFLREKIEEGFKRIKFELNRQNFKAVNELSKKVTFGIVQVFMMKGVEVREKLNFGAWLLMVLNRNFKNRPERAFKREFLKELASFLNKADIPELIKRILKRRKIWKEPRRLFKRLRRD